MVLCVAFAGFAVPSQASATQLTCPSGSVCFYGARYQDDAESWWGTPFYDSNQVWRALPTSVRDKVSSIHNNQTADGNCTTSTSSTRYPWVYVSDTGPSGRVGLLMSSSGPVRTSAPAPAWTPLEDRINDIYNRCTGTPPNYQST